MKYNDIKTIVSDIKDKRKNIIIVVLDVYNKNNLINTYNIELNLTKMNLNYKMDYEFQLSKDLDKIVKNYFIRYEKLPQKKYIEEKMINKNYIIIKNKSYKCER